MCGIDLHPRSRLRTLRIRLRLESERFRPTSSATLSRKTAARAGSKEPVTLHSITLLVFVVLAFSDRATGADWTLVQHEGREYVTLRDVQRFYGFSTPVRAENKITMRSARNRIECAVSSKDFLINGIKFILSAPILELEGQVLLARIDLTKLVEPVLRPSRIRGAGRVRTIVLDAGHGGHDVGARSAFGVEKNYTLDVALRARKLLIARGYKVHLTRSYDRFMPLEDRAHFANNFNNAIFISIHFNAGSSSATGFETYSLAPRFAPSHASEGPMMSDTIFCPGNARDPENMALATAMHASLLKTLPMFDRGIKRARFVVLRETEIPSVLLEGGFLSNLREASKIAAEGYRQRMAIAIAEGVENYQGALLNRSLATESEPAQMPAAAIPTESPSPSTSNDEPVVVTPGKNQ